jgi:hypothetical protein
MNASAAVLSVTSSTKVYVWLPADPKYVFLRQSAMCTVPVIAGFATYQVSSAGIASRQ